MVGVVIIIAMFFSLYVKVCVFGYLDAPAKNKRTLLIVMGLVGLVSLGFTCWYFNLPTVLSQNTLPALGYLYANNVLGLVLVVISSIAVALLSLSKDEKGSDL